MNREFSISVLGVAFLAMTVIAPVTADQPPESPASLRLRSTSALQASTDRRSGVRVVHARPGHVSEVARKLEAQDMVIVSYIPDNALLVMGDVIDKKRVMDVISISEWTAAQATTPELRHLTSLRAASFPAGVPVIVALDSELALSRAVDELNKGGAAISWVDGTAAVPQLGMQIPADRLDAARGVIDSLPGLVWADVQPGYTCGFAQSNRPNLT